MKFRYGALSDTIQFYICQFFSFSPETLKNVNHAKKMRTHWNKAWNVSIVQYDFIFFIRRIMQKIKLIVNKHKILQLSKLSPVVICNRWLWTLLADGYARYWVIDDEIDNRICKFKKNVPINKATIVEMEMAISNSFHNQKPR